MTETHRPGSQPEIPSERLEPVRKDPKQGVGSSGNTREILRSRRGTILLATIVGFGASAVASGTIQDLDPVESIGYAFLRIGSAASADPLGADFVRELRVDIDANDSEAIEEKIDDIADRLDIGIARGVVTIGGVGLTTLAVRKYVDGQKEQKQRINEGKEPLKPKKGEKFFALGGSTSSHIIEELVKSGAPIVPIFETEQTAEGLSGLVDTQRPYYLNLGTSNYLENDIWDSLKLDEDNLIHSVNGKRYLMVVGFGMNRGSELSRHPDNLDLEQIDLRNAAIGLLQLLPKSGLDTHDIVDVFIGSGEIVHRDILSGKSISDKQLASSTGVDIYVDAMDLAIKSVVEELKRSKTNTINLATTSSDYLARIGEKLPELSRMLGHEVKINMDPGNEDTGVWLVYEGDNDETFNAARKLRKILDPEDPDEEKPRILALVTRDLEESAETAGLDNVALINASSIVADVIDGIRVSLGNGATPDKIQEALDNHKKLPIPIKPASDRITA